MRLETTLTLARILLALAGAFAFAAAGYELLAARPVVRHLDGVLTRAEGVESKLNATATNLDHATAAWAQSSQEQAAQVVALTHDMQATLRQAQGAIAETQTTVATINDQARGIAPLLASLQASSDAIPPALREAQLTVADLRNPVDAGTLAIGDLRARINAQDLTDSLQNLNDGTASMADIADKTDKAWSKVIDPPPCTGQWCWLKKSYSFLNGVVTFASKASPAAYWGEQFFQSIHK